MTESQTAQPTPGWAAHLVEALGVALVWGVGLLAILQPLPKAPASRPGAIPAAGCQLDPDGYLRGTVYGALALEFNWSGRNLACDGMLRPDGRGMRLFFARNMDGAGHRVVVVLGIDAPTEALVGQEQPANVTVIDERSGRFFSSGGTGRCWTTVASMRQVPLEGAGALRIEGRLYCSGALPSLKDLSSLTLGDISYAGRLSPDGS